jgi:hypothetical protein
MPKHKKEKTKENKRQNKKEKRQNKSSFLLRLKIENAAQCVSMSPQYRNVSCCLRMEHGI